MEGKLLFQFLRLRYVKIRFTGRRNLSFLVLNLRLISNLLRFLSTIQRVGGTDAIHRPFLIFRVVFRLVAML